MAARTHSFARARTAALLLASACMASACAATPVIDEPTARAAPPGETDRTYRLGIGDKMKITVFGEENLSGQFEVNALGQVAVPLIGEVPASGRPISEFRNEIARRLSDGYLKNPRVTVDVLNYRPIYVHGEVKSGGEFAFKSGLRLRDAIALAGGFTYRANQSYVVVLRDGAGEINAATMGKFTILPGDNIRVPERFF